MTPMQQLKSSDRLSEVASHGQWLNHMTSDTTTHDLDILLKPMGSKNNTELHCFSLYGYYMDKPQKKGSEWHEGE